MRAFLRNILPQFLAVAGITAVVAAFGLLGPLGFAAPALGMAIGFNTIPNGLRVPFQAAEFDNSLAARGLPVLSYRALLIGQKTSGGSATANTIVGPVTNADQVATQAGRGSVLHRQALAWFASNQFTELWIGVLADNGSGVAALGNLSFTGSATAAGTIHLYVGGDYLPVAVASGDSASTIATNVTAAVTSNQPVTAAVDGTHTYQVDFTAKNKGTFGNDIDLRLNYQVGQSLPAGVGVTVTAMASGATNPSLTSLITAMGDVWYHIIAHPYADATSLTAIENELARRAGPMVQKDGFAIASESGSQSTLATLGASRNSRFSCIIAAPGKNPVTPSFEFSAETAALVALYGAIDPARPFQTLAYTWAQPPAEVDQFTLTERNLNLKSGIATSRVGAGEVVQIERVITTYQTNAAGSPDTSYLDLTSGLTLMYLRYSFENRMSNKYPRHKIADDGTRVGAGQPVITPMLGKAEAIAWFRENEDAGLVEDFDQFKTDLIVERDGSDPNRMNFLLPVNIINQFVVGATKIQFRL